MIHDARQRQFVKEVLKRSKEIMMLERQAQNALELRIQKVAELETFIESCRANQKRPQESR